MDSVCHNTHVHDSIETLLPPYKYCSFNHKIDNDNACMRRSQGIGLTLKEDKPDSATTHTLDKESNGWSTDGRGAGGAAGAKSINRSRTPSSSVTAPVPLPSVGSMEIARPLARSVARGSEAPAGRPSAAAGGPGPRPTWQPCSSAAPGPSPAAGRPEITRWTRPSRPDPTAHRAAQEGGEAPST